MPRRVVTRREMLATPPAMDAPLFAQDYEQSQYNPESFNVQKSKYYTRGYDWETIPENIARLHTMPQFKLDLPLRLHTWGGADDKDWENIYDVEQSPEGNWHDHWRNLDSGQWNSVSKPGVGYHHQIHLHPLGSPEATNATLWHELQHAYQFQEGRFWDEPEYQKNRVNDTSQPNYSDQPDEVDAEALAAYMRKYPLVRAVEPKPNPYWFGNSYHLDGDWDPENEEFKASDDKMHGDIRTWRNMHGF